MQTKNIESMAVPPLRPTSQFYTCAIRLFRATGADGYRMYRYNTDEGQKPAMTTTPIEQPDDSGVPRWFYEFALANAAQHAELADRIAQAEQRSIDRIGQAEQHNMDRTAQAEQRGIDRTAQAEQRGIDRTAQAEQQGIDRTAQAEQRGIDRITRVEERVVALEQRVARMETRIIRWVVGSAVGMVGVFAAVVAAAAAAWAVWGPIQG